MARYAVAVYRRYATKQVIDPHRLVQRWRGVSDQEAWAQRLNAYLGDGWPAPPYSGDQVATLALCIEMARE